MFIFNKNLPKNKVLFYSLRLIYGLNKNNLRLIFKKLGFSKNLKPENLTNKQIYNLTQFIVSFNILITNDLKKLQFLLLRKLNIIKTIKIFRFSKNLPVNGQRTRTNANTRRKIKK